MHKTWKTPKHKKETLFRPEQSFPIKANIYGLVICDLGNFSPFLSPPKRTSLCCGWKRILNFHEMLESFVNYR